MPRRATPPPAQRRSAGSSALHGADPRTTSQDLFPDMAIVDVMAFRVTRNADLERDEEDADDLLELMEDELRQRRFADVVRLEHGAEAEPWMLEFLIARAGAAAGRRLRDAGRAGLRRPEADRRPEPSPKLKYEPWTPLAPPALADEDADIFSVIRSGDVLVHTPYESFTASVERFIKPGRRRPEGAGDQDDALPHRRRQPVRAARSSARPRRASRSSASSSSRPGSTKSATSSSPTRWKRPACTSSTASSG